MTEIEAETGDVFSFGPFTLMASERLLTKGGTALQLGTRALDILIVLVSRASQTISKQDLLAEIWPDMTVGESSLRFHMTNLRKALGDGRGGARYIATLAGRGYCFVAPVSRSSKRDRRTETTGPSPGSLPNRLTRMVGRADGILMISTQLIATRFVTIVGAGGVGKTTVAVAVGHELFEAFAGAVHFIDLGALSDPSLVAASLAAMLGVAIRSDDPITGLIAYLRTRRIVLILDNCEHLIESAASLAARIFVGAPQAHILATSREPLRVEGEHVYRLAPLAFPTEELGLTAAVALTYSAVELFVERATANDGKFELDDSNAAIAAGICRKLDGIALAIELAARRVEAFGLHQIAALLDERLSLLWPGQRTAPSRQKTLRATLDWSYGLLSELEQRVLRWLAVFVGSFTLEAARAVLTRDALDEASVLMAIDSLVSKSLVASEESAPARRWRLLEPVRAYALEKLGEIGEAAPAARAHAEYYRDFIAAAAPASWSDATLSGLTACYRAIDNVRAALEWTSSPTGDPKIGIVLTTVFAPIWIHYGLIVECHARVGWALDRFDPDLGLSVRHQMYLLYALGELLFLTMGPVDRAQMVLIKAAGIAESQDDLDNLLKILRALWAVQLDIGEFPTARSTAQRFSRAAHSASDPAYISVADRLVGHTLHYSGNQHEAQPYLEHMLELHDTANVHRHGIGFQFDDQHVLGRSVLARILWLRGFVDQAVVQAEAARKEGQDEDRELSVWWTLRLAVCPIALMTGDLTLAGRAAATSIEIAARHNVQYMKILARCLEGQVLVSQREFRAGSALLRGSLETCNRTGWTIFSHEFQGALAEGSAGQARRSARHRRPNSGGRGTQRRALVHRRAPSHPGQLPARRRWRPVRT